MTKPKTKTVAHLILDMTGSMTEHRTETMEAFNSYINGLKEDKDTKRFKFTFSVFNSDIGVKNIVSQGAMKDVPVLNAGNYSPSGMTPLFDAIGKAIHEADQEANEGDAVLIVVQTDGLNNASHEFTHTAIQSLVKERTEKGWQFVFLGCGIDAMAAGGAIGIAPGNTLSYVGGESVNTMRRVTSQTVAYASAGSRSSKDFMSRTADDSKS